MLTAYDLLDIVVARPEAAIVYVSCQLGHVRESIVHCLCHWGFLGIYPTPFGRDGNDDVGLCLPKAKVFVNK